MNQRSLKGGPTPTPSSPVAPQGPRLSGTALTAAVALAGLVIVGGGAVAARVASVLSGTADFGYPVLGDTSPELVKSWASLRYSKEVIDTHSLPSFDCEFIGSSEDTVRAASVKQILIQMMDEVPFSPDQDLSKVVFIFSTPEEAALLEGNYAVTPVSRSEGVQYVILSRDAGDDVVAHELIHAVWQTEASKGLPYFISEGITYAYRNPEPDFTYTRVDPKYLFSTLSGLYAEDGSISQGLFPSDADNLQYEVMHRFWIEISTIDPGIIPILLQLPSSHSLTLAEIPEFILSFTSPYKRDAMTNFLKGCAIFEPVAEENLFLVPDLDESQHPRVVIYHLDEDHLEIPGPMPFWYKSSDAGVPLSGYLEEPHLAESNQDLVFTRHRVYRDDFRFTIKLIDPSTSEPTDFSFTFDPENGEWEAL